MEPELSQNIFDCIGKDYEDTYADNKPLYELVQRAAKQLPSTSGILDVGSGTGKPVSDSLAAHDHRVHWIDTLKVMIDLSREQVPNAIFELADMLEYAPSEKFDAVFAMFV